MTAWMEAHILQLAAVLGAYLALGWLARTLTRLWRKRRPEGTSPVNPDPRDRNHDGHVSLAERLHPAVIHPRDLLATERRLIARRNDWAATRMGALFGSAWMIWIFFTTPLLAQFFPKSIQDQFFYYSSGWVQLFALPLFVYIGNKLQRTTDAQSQAMHDALSHIALTVDAIERRVPDRPTSSASPEGAKP